MPTGNEFSVVLYGNGDQSYKQTDREMSGGIEPQIGGPGNPLPSGNYPRTFDREAGSDPMTPSGYPEQVFSDISATGPGQSYTQTERQSVSGEYGQSDGITNPLYPGNNMVPDNVPSKQFSSKMSGDPKELLQSARSGVDAHADLMAAYGYNQPMATMGSHPWLRDELTVTSEREPGNQMPSDGNAELPKRG